MKELEEQMRGWVPRRPSARIEETLFGSARQAEVVGESAGASFRWRWLVPATAAFLLTCALFNQRNIQGVSSSSGSAALVAVALSNQSAAAWLPGSFSAEQNSLPVESFEWTNAGGSTSSIRSLPGGRGGK